MWPEHPYRRSGSAPQPKTAAYEARKQNRANRLKNRRR